MGHLPELVLPATLVVVEAFVGIVTVSFVSGDVRNSFLYCGPELDVKYMGLLALWWLAGWCLVK